MDTANRAGAAGWTIGSGSAALGARSGGIETLVTTGPGGVAVDFSRSSWVAFMASVSRSETMASKSRESLKANCPENQN